MRSSDALPPPALRTFHRVTHFVEDLLEAPLVDFFSINELSVDHFCNFFALPAIAKFSATLHWF
jgi:hypothetical protein